MSAAPFTRTHSPAQIALARALVGHPRWRWAAPMEAAQPGGAVLEVRSGAAHVGEALPNFGASGTLAALVRELDGACGAGVRWEVGRRGGVYWCRLEAGAFAREWAAATVGEAVAHALLARWGALGREGRASDS